MVEYIVQNSGALIEVVTQIIGAFAVIATLTPNSSDNAIADGLMRLVNFLGGNFGRAKNG
jgi:hypothetical protein